MTPQANTMTDEEADRLLGKAAGNATQSLDEAPVPGPALLLETGPVNLGSIPLRRMCLSDFLILLKESNPIATGKLNTQDPHAGLLAAVEIIFILSTKTGEETLETYRDPSVPWLDRISTFAATVECSKPSDVLDYAVEALNAAVETRIAARSPKIKGVDESGGGTEKNL